MQSVTPKVSVVLPTHNRPDLLLEAIESVAAQNYDNWELIVVDDASLPIAQIPEDSQGRIRLVRHESARGGAESKNTGVQHARGELVAFLDDDDLYDSAYLSTAVSIFSRDARLDTLFMGVDWFGSASDWGRNAYHQAMKKLLKTNIKDDLNTYHFGLELVPLLLNSVPMAFQRPVVRREQFYIIGAYRGDCLLWDCDWAIRASIASKCALVDQPLYRQRVDHQGFSSRPSRAVEHMRSNVDIKQQILLALRKDAEKKNLIPVFEKALSKAWMDRAYFHHNESAFNEALACWFNSQKADPSLRKTSFLVKLISGSFKALFSKTKSNPKMPEP